MNLRTRIRRWLGITEIREDQSALHRKIQEAIDEVFKLRNELSVTLYAEDHPERRRLSNELGNRVVKKMRADDLARRVAGGEMSSEEARQIAQKEGLGS